MGKHIEWSQYLGNNTSALDMVRGAGASSVPALVDICEAGYKEYGASEIDVYWEDVVSSLLRAAAEQRVREDRLEDFEDAIFYDWPEGDDHLLWVAIAPLAELRDWAEQTQEAQQHA